MPDLEWKAPAISDLMAIVEYIADDDPSAAQALKDEIDRRVSDLPRHPKMYRSERIEGTREMVVRPNYIVVYSEALTGSQSCAFFMRHNTGREHCGF